MPKNQPDKRQGNSGGNYCEKSERYRIHKSFVRHQTQLRNFISRYLVPNHDIDDIAQETFLRAFEAEKMKRIDQPKAFLFRIAKNLMLSEISKKSHKITDYIEEFKSEEDLLSSDTLEDNVMAQQKLGIICEAVASLPPQCRKVFLLKKVYGLSHKAIAEHMGITVSTVEKHILKGLLQRNEIVAGRYESNTVGSNPVGSRRNVRNQGRGDN